MGDVGANDGFEFGLRDPELAISFRPVVRNARNRSCRGGLEELHLIVLSKPQLLNLVESYLVRILRAPDALCVDGG